MALPVKNSSRIFNKDQSIYFEVDYWDTVFTYPSEGMEYMAFDLFDPAFAPADKAALDAALNLDTSANRSTNAILGYVSKANGAPPKVGRIPNVYKYWGAGTVDGGQREKLCLVKFAGYSKVAGTTTFVFGGNGELRSYYTRNGVTSVLKNGTLNEPDTDLDFIMSSSLDAGYLTHTMTVQVGDYFEFYYWHAGENWGGVFAKAIPGTASLSLPTFLEEVRNAPIISASFLGAEVGGTDLSSTVLGHVSEARITWDKGGAPTMELKMPITTSEFTTGFRYEMVGEQGQLTNNSPAGGSVKVGRRIAFRGGFAHPDNSIEQYPRFTGYIEDIIPSLEDEYATITCRGFEGRLLDTFDENLPDRLSYLSNGYVFREFVGEPVWPIPAFDFWPLETAVGDLCYRAGVDSYNLGLSPVTASPDYGKRKYVVDATQADYWGQKLFSARMRADASQKIILERQDNYGNVGILKKEYLPNDDSYLHSPEITERLYDRAVKFSGNFGYDFGFNASGQAYIQARNNPTSFVFATTLGQAGERVTPSAVGGRYLYKRHTVDGTGQLVQVVGYFARADLVVSVGREAATGLNGGLLSVTVEYHNGSTWVTVPGWPQTVTTFYDGDELFFYDNAIAEDSTNVCTINLMGLPFNQYRVTVSSAGPDTYNIPAATDCVYRINGLDLYERDPFTSAYPETFSTLENITGLTPESNRKELRNHVVVVGGRKAAVTDSLKADQDTNPNNPEQEFHVSVASNPASMHDPTSPEYVGAKRSTVIFDDKVVDSDFASWLARTLILRQRLPLNSARVEHTVIPAMELRDAVMVVEEKYQSISHVLWVEQFTETWTTMEAMTTFETTSFVELPSYQPREDIDIDSLFDHDGDGMGEPIINLKINYKNIYGVAVGNTDLDNPTMLQSKANNSYTPMVQEVASSPNHVCAQAAIPETTYLRWYDNVDTDKKRVLVNSPYRHFWKYTWGNKIPTLNFDFQEGDGSSKYDMTYYGFPSTGNWRVCYDYFQARTGTNPFYDPYTSEVGNYVSIKFDALISGRYRVSVWHADKSGLLVTRVAWLTRIDQDGTDENKHWQYMDAGEDKEFIWDGVDNIGEWNLIQSAEQAEILEGTFGDEPIAVGAGYYAWNDRGTSLHTQIGDAVDDNYPRSGGTPNGAPYYTIGQYSKFLIVVEVQNDALMRRNNESEPRTVISNDLPLTYESGPNLGNATGWHDVDQTYVWVHLGEPNQVEITMKDWVGAGSWTPGLSTSESDWGAIDSDASIRDGKPVRFKFNAIARRGKMFEVANVSNSAFTNVKLNRRVGLKGTIFDQFWTLFGKPWDKTNAEMKRLTNRMFHNEDHTLEFQDDTYRSGSDLATYEWIFQPSLFKKDFGNNREERLKYCDYEQLEALPGHSSRRSGGSSLAERAYMNLAFMNYLFYMSAHTLDRSGRRQWCLNRSFIDRSKIVSDAWLTATSATKPEYTVNYVSNGADRYLARSIFVRQWKEPTWTSTYPGNPKTKYGITDAHQSAFLQLKVTDFGLESDYLNHPTQAVGAFDRHLRSYAVAGTKIITNFIRKGASTMQSNAVVEVGGTAQNRFYRRVAQFGSWDFNRDSLTNWYTPSPTMDFHPYWRYPYMPDWSTWGWHYYTSIDNSINYQSALEMPASAFTVAMRDGAEQENWFGWTIAEYSADVTYTAGSGEVNKLADYGMHLEHSAQDMITLSTNPIAGLIGYSQTAAEIFDYMKQDQLDRFDQFRGVYSRGKFATRDREDSNYWETKADRSAPRRPVKAAGTYLLNLANYDRYYVAPAHDSLRKKNVEDVGGYEMHFVGRVSDWFDIRFRSEYVWYNDQWFPVEENGASCYGYFQNELTNAREFIGGFWWEDMASPLYFDPGAWTGWKDDVKSAAWTASPRLRWNEASSIDPTNKTYDGNSANPSGYQGRPWRYGGDTDTRATDFMGNNLKSWAHANIFDEYLSHRWWRLAVGPRVPETYNLVMNLVLPERLKS